MGPLRPTPRPVTRINRLTLLLGVAVLLAIVAGLAYVKTKIHMPRWNTATEEAPVQMAKLPEVLTKPAPTYQAPAPPPTRELPPMAIPLVRTPQPAVKPWPDPVPAPSPTQKPPTQQAITLPDFLQPRPEDQRKEPERTGSDRAETRKAEKPAPKPWHIVPIKGNLDGTEPKKLEVSKEASEQKGQAANLIKPATWARPARPDLTIFRSQILPCKTKQAINSDIPGSVVVETTVPIFDKVNAGQVILPKDSLIIMKQTGKAEYGQSRIPLTLEQIELPGPAGIVISMKADAGDKDGARGIEARTNNHWGKLIGATLINAVLQIGLGSATGTPQGFYQSPTQRATQEAGIAVTQDINSVVQRQLKVLPTLEVPAGTICSISLEENIQFNRQPMVVK